MGSIVRLSRVVTTQPRNVLQHKTGSGGHPGHGHLCCSSASTGCRPSHLPKLSFLWTLSPRSSWCSLSCKILEDSTFGNSFSTNIIFRLLLPMLLPRLQFVPSKPR